MGKYDMMMLMIQFCQLNEDIDKSCKISKERHNCELFIILECIFCRIHRLIEIKLIDMCAQQIKCMGCVMHVPACSRAIVHVSLKGLCTVQFVH